MRDLQPDDGKHHRSRKDPWINRNPNLRCRAVADLHSLYGGSKKEINENLPFYLTTAARDHLYGGKDIPESVLQCGKWFHKYGRI